MLNIVAILFVSFLSAPAFAQDSASNGNEFQDNLYKEEATVVLPVFYVVKFDAEGYQVVQDATTTKHPTPTVIYTPKNTFDGTYSNMVNPHLFLEKLTKKIDEQLDTP